MKINPLSFEIIITHKPYNTTWFHDDLIKDSLMISGHAEISM